MEEDDAVCTEGEESEEGKCCVEREKCGSGEDCSFMDGSEGMRWWACTGRREFCGVVAVLAEDF